MNKRTIAIGLLAGLAAFSLARADDVTVIQRDTDTTGSSIIKKDKPKIVVKESEPDIVIREKNDAKLIVKDREPGIVIKEKRKDPKLIIDGAINID